MTTAQTARMAARDWLTANQARWPGLRAAHFVGSITTMPDDAPYPPAKDIDLHLILDDDSPALIPQGPFPTLVEELVGAWPIEAGLKPLSEYRSPETVLGNPEIAHHLTVDSSVFDPDGLLASLQAPVRAQYAQRLWVEARLAYERQAFAGALAMRPLSDERFGRSGTPLLFGYLMTFPSACFGIAALGPPKAGGKAIVQIRETLSSLGHRDLYDAWLALRNLTDLTPAAASRWLETGVALFDRAVAVRKTPHPFQHKLHAHLHDYYRDACTALIAEGNHREALIWSTPFHLSALQVLLADGSADDRADAEQQMDAYLTVLGFTSSAETERRFARALEFYQALFALTETIARNNLAVRDVEAGFASG